MSRERKTIDVWRFFVDYGYGEEHELDEYTPSEARKRLREYQENCPQYPARIRKGREPIKKLHFYGGHELGGYRPAAGLVRSESDPEGTYKIVYVYGRPLERDELGKSGLAFIKEEEKDAGLC